MKRRLVHAAGIVLLAISVALVVWQGSFHFGGYGPSGATETLILWAISTLNFLLMVTLAFMLGRAGVKLYVERRRGHVGSRIKTKLVLGAVTLSSMPVFFLVLFSYQVLNRNLDKWFSKPSEAAHVSYREIAGALEEQVRQSAELRARLLAASPELGEPGFVERFAREHALAWVEIAGRGSYGSLAPGLVFAQAGRVRVAVRAPVDVAEKQRAIDRYNAYQAGLAARRKDVRQFYLAMMALITLFILFVATWIALFLARLISVPISELAHAAGEVRKGNLDHRVAVEAVDELADLVRNFNQMTAELGANSRELEARRRFTEAILESIPSGVLSVSWDGSIRRANRALGKMFPGD
ncbi:MAG: HAMP domain-containing protein, partial [Acidobacteria bacterium]|nr:HAMP domain-containing protein [Acidobacteriota bacterium]